MREMIAGVVAEFPALDGASFVSARQENLETIHQHNVVAERHGLLAEMRSEIDSGAAAPHQTTLEEWLDAGSRAQPSGVSLVLRHPPAQPEEVVKAREHRHDHRDVDAVRSATAGEPWTAITARIIAI